jgi:hypothetical protein
MELEVERDREKMEKLRSEICLELDDIIKIINEVTRKNNRKSPDEMIMWELIKIKLNLNDKKDLEIFLRIDKDRLFKKGFYVPDLASSCYERAYESDHSNSILYMGDFINATVTLPKDEVLTTLKKLFGNEWILIEFEKNIGFFIDKVIPILIKLNILRDLREIGLDLEILTIDGPQDDYEDTFLDIRFKKEEIFKKIQVDIDIGDYPIALRRNFQDEIRRFKELIEMMDGEGL